MKKTDFPEKYKFYFYDTIAKLIHHAKIITYISFDGMFRHGSTYFVIFL